MNLPNIPKITVQSTFNALVYAVVVGGVFYAARLGASKVGGTVAQVVNKAADIAQGE